jgi:5-carboxymethyl-2-hydroxymuconate isomerase
MPHLILEASANIYESNARIKRALMDCQKLLVAELPTELSSCKSRVVLHDIYVVADDAINNAFIHLTVKILKGRSTELIRVVAEKLRLALLTNFVKSKDALNLSISVEIVELNDSYVK